MRVSINGQTLPPTQSVVSVSNPAAGADFSYTVPTGSFYRLIAVNYTLTTDANVANRLGRVRVKRGTPTIAVAAGAAVVAAGSTRVYFWNLGTVANTVTATSDISPLVGFPTLVAGDVIDSFLLNKQVGDQLSTVTLVFEVI